MDKYESGRWKDESGKWKDEIWADFEEMLVSQTLVKKDHYEVQKKKKEKIPWKV